MNSAAAAGQRPISKQSSRGDDNTNTDPGRKHKHKKKKSQKPAEEEEAERETDSDSPPPAKPGRSHPGRYTKEKVTYLKPFIKKLFHCWYQVQMGKGHRTS